MAINQKNKFFKTNDVGMRHGIGRYRAMITSTTASGTTDITAAGDYTVNFPMVFKNPPVVVGTALSTGTAGAAGTYPTVWVKSVTATSMVVSLGGAVGTLADVRITVDVEGSVS